MNEFDFIKKISKNIPNISDGLLKGIGDDAAVIEASEDNAYIITTDILAEDIHFEREWIDWGSFGKKALAINISDIAAMGGLPLYYLVSLSVPKNLKEKDILTFFKGMKSSADKYGMIMIGGDTTESKSSLFLSVTVIGSAKKEEIIYRNGAEKGDSIFLTGSLGHSSAGLKFLKKGIRNRETRPFINKHLSPEPRLNIARLLAENSLATAMIDLSDGLISDINHIAEDSKLGYVLHFDKMKTDKSFLQIADKYNLNCNELILSGGEDYELLFTMNSDQELKFRDLYDDKKSGIQVSKIGKMTENKKSREILDENGRVIDLKISGYIHRIGS